MSKLTVQQSIDNAKKVLRDNGYFVDILWSVEDVWDERFDCSEKIDIYIKETIEEIINLYGNRYPFSILEDGEEMENCEYLNVGQIENVFPNPVLPVSVEIPRP